MSNLKFLFETSPWWIVLCVAVGALYSFFLYSKDQKLEKPINCILAILRFFWVSLLALVLLSIFVKSIQNKTQKKVLGILIDNSASIEAIGKSNIASLKLAIEALQKNLIDSDYEVVLETLNGTETNIDSLQFNQKNSPIGSLINNFKVNNEGKYITDAILISDGINNEGASPLGLKLPFKIHTLGVGDSTQKRDIYLKNLVANKIAYLGNQFQVNAEIGSFGFKGKIVTIAIKQNGNVIQNKTITLAESKEPITINFDLTAKKAGLNKFLVQVSPLQGEASLNNNTQEVIVDVIDGKQKILILAAAAHPDIKAIASALENNQNFEVITAVEGQAISTNFGQKFDLIIAHNLPNKTGKLQTVLNNFIQQKVATLFVTGSETNMGALNAFQKTVQIQESGGQFDKAQGTVNQNFTGFDIDKAGLSKLLNLAPEVTVPYGNFKVNGQTILSQKIGDSNTQKPLLSIGTETPKTGVLLGEGIWAWRMEEYAKNDNSLQFDDLINKLCQYLALQDDTRKLRIYPQNKIIILGESVQLETETYDDLFKKIYNQKINLNLSSNSGFEKSYNYSNLEGNTALTIANLPAGEYSYTAQSTINSKNHTSQGQFIIKSVDTEMDNLQADFNMLKLLSQSSEGQFYNVSQLGQLEQALRKSTVPNKIISEERLEELIQWPWLLAIILLLAIIEWAARKYFGSY